MTKKITIAIIGTLVLLTMLWRCVQQYVSPYKSPATGYLVVDGYITGNGPTIFTLSRTIPLSGNVPVPMETGAKVQVEGNDNSVYPLTEGRAGVYMSDSLSLNPAVEYRLRINTAGGVSYLSDFVPFKPTPLIDSVNWVYNSSGVTIYANAHDVSNSTRYYQWQYGETWEYHAAEPTGFEYDGDTVPDMIINRPTADQIYRCWHTDSSSSILIGSSAKLAKDVIYEHPLIAFPKGSQQLGVLYNIRVRQYAITEDGYNYLSLMQKNTESLGSIFDAQPSQLVGNIHCLSDSTTPVIGYISAGTVQQQQIFISVFQLPNWDFYNECPVPDDTLMMIDPVHLKDYFSSGSAIPVQAYFVMGHVVGWIFNGAGCVDCRTQGGVTQEPAYWPN